MARVHPRGGLSWVCDRFIMVCAVGWVCDRFIMVCAVIDPQGCGHAGGGGGGGAAGVGGAAGRDGLRAFLVHARLQHYEGEDIGAITVDGSP